MNLEFIIKALSEADNYPSSIRLFSALVIFLFVPVLAFGFVYVLFVDRSLVIAYAGVLSALISAVLSLKVFQRGKEEKNAG